MIACRAPALFAVATALAAVGLGLLLLQREDPAPSPSRADERLEPLVESPRPMVVAEPPRPTLQGRPPAPSAQAPEGDAAALRRERNELAREHGRRVAAYEAGLVSIQEVEEAEMRLLDARHRSGELDGPAWHRARAVLVGRAVERTSLLAEAGRASTSELERVRLSLEKERLLGGETSEYAEKRDAFLAATRDMNRALVDAGRVSEQAVQREFALLEAEFPTAEVVTARDR